LKNLSYDSSIPVFYLQDKFHIDEYLRNCTGVTSGGGDFVGNKVHICEQFHFEFSQNSIEKSQVYILSEARRVLLIRNFELHTILKTITFDNNTPINFAISPDSAYIIYLFQNSFRINNLNT